MGAFVFSQRSLLFRAGRCSSFSYPPLIDSTLWCLRSLSVVKKICVLQVFAFQFRDHFLLSGNDYDPSSRESASLIGERYGDNRGKFFRRYERRVGHSCVLTCCMCILMHSQWSNCQHIMVFMKGKQGENYLTWSVSRTCAWLIRSSKNENSKWFNIFISEGLKSNAQKCFFEFIVRMTQITRLAEIRNHAAKSPKKSRRSGWGSK